MSAPWVTVVLTGSAVRLIGESSWPKDCPEGYRDVQSGRRRKSGSGSRVTVVLWRNQAADLAAHLESIAAVEASMTATERDGSRDGQIAREAAARIRRSLGEEAA